MAGRQAQLLTERALARALKVTARGPTPERDQVMLLLSARAGLRACEIAGLEWGMLLDSHGRLACVIELRDNVSKYGSGRRLPLHRELGAALRHLKQISARPAPTDPVVRSLRGAAMRPSSVVNWFSTTFLRAGFAGCTSHSGRRAFITRAARNAHRAGASLRDVQLLAGHRSIEVTQGYIEGDSDAQRRLIRTL